MGRARSGMHPRIEYLVDGLTLRVLDIDVYTSRIEGRRRARTEFRYKP